MILNKFLLLTLILFSMSANAIKFGSRTGFSIESNDFDLVATLSNNHLFHPQTPALTETGRKILKAILKKIPPNKSPEIIVEGHTSAAAVKDADKFRYPSNWELAASRAGSVLRFIQKHKPKNMKSISLHSKADTDPIAPNYTIDGRNLNKRVVIRVSFQKRPEAILAKKKEVIKKPTIRPLIANFLYADIKRCEGLSKKTLHTFYLKPGQKVFNKDEMKSINNILNYILHRGKLISLIINSRSSSYGAMLDNKQQKYFVDAIQKIFVKEIAKKHIKQNIFSTSVLIKEQEEDSIEIQTIRCDDIHKPFF